MAVQLAGMSQRPCAASGPYCVLGVTLTDIYCGADDVFTGGLASQQPSGSSPFATCAAKAAGGANGRAGCPFRVATCSHARARQRHEVLHMYSIGHCVPQLPDEWRRPPARDFAAPPYCCPVDLSKLVAALGQRASSCTATAPCSPSATRTEAFRAKLRGFDALGLGGWIVQMQAVPLASRTAPPHVCRVGCCGSTQRVEAAAALHGKRRLRTWLRRGAQRMGGAPRGPMCGGE